MGDFISDRTAWGIARDYSLFAVIQKQMIKNFLWFNLQSEVAIKHSDKASAMFASTNVQASKLSRFNLNFSTFN